ncbi:class I SAM-dependent methyltransferase [Candidatus Magnetominusculus xianensis]|nr:class I SAM-dependent methyltransferase [Candidatus Magnetominusculus xianensis]MBF0403629.1 class I SAM-dependent methyltransferase [Nitrospirota bacterium]
MNTNDNKDILRTWRKVFNRDYSSISIHSLLWRFKYFTAPIYETEILLPDKGDILDLGCGEGNYCRFISEVSSDRNILGLDINNERITRAIGDFNNNKNIKYICSSIHEIDESCLFDAIVIHHVLYLIEHREQIRLLKKCFEILRPGGKLVILSLDIKQPFFNVLIHSMFYGISAITTIAKRYLGISTERLTGIRLNKPTYLKDTDYIEIMNVIGFKLDKITENNHFPLPYLILCFKKH